ncbi:MAG: FHA domain-containing protein, partial [Ruminiclostridium sp.]|nr:FHA domain-containing protein [Ruminiclostridium sp.]
MQEIFERIRIIFSKLSEQVHGALANTDPGQTVLAVIDAVLPVVCGVLRVLAIIVAIIVIARCLLSLFREKPGKEIWGWLSMNDGTRFDLRHWENTVGRGRFSDVLLDFPTVSRSHIALLRDDKGNWRLQPLQTKNGTRINKKPVEHTCPVKTGDIID